MEEKRNYVVYSNANGKDIEYVIKVTKKQAKIIDCYIDGAVELAENYKEEEI